jgi:uncharacterized protein YceH (UPF0502 family)
MTLPTLSVLEARVLGVLVEKEHTVPDIYPLSLNALTAGCNQKNNRDPVLTATEAQVQAALDALKSPTLVIESSGARVSRYSHNLGRVLKVPAQVEALLATLMLRGPQTAGELRINSERLHRFADISSVEAFLEELATRPDSQGGALVVRLPRLAGSRENRWAHLLSGPVEIAAEPAPARHAPAAADLDALRHEVEQLRAEVAALRAEVAALAPPSPTPPAADA